MNITEVGDTFSCDCGFSWTRGFSGSHDCDAGLRRQIADFKELAANREAQPVFFIEIEGDDWINAGRIEGNTRPDLGLLPDGINYLYAAPPAPVVNPEFTGATAVPDKISASLETIANGYQLSIPQAEAYRFGWNECRAAMLTQPVSQGYKLVPVEPTPKQWAAGVKAMDAGMDKVTLVYKAMLATAPTQGEKQ